MIDISMLRNTSNEARNLLELGQFDEKAGKDVFCKLLEILGYDIESLIYPGGHGSNNEVTFDMACKTDPYIDESVKLYVKFIDREEDLNGYEELVMQTATYEGGVGEDKIKYFIICNYDAFKIYVCNPGVTSLITIDTSWEIVEMTNLEESLTYLNELAANPEEEREDENPEEEISEPINEKPKKELDKATLTKIGMIIAAIIFIFLIFSFLFKGNGDNPNPSSSNTNNTEEQIPGKNTQNSVNIGSNQTSSEAYLTIKSVLDLNVTNEKLTVNLISDIEKGAIIKIGIFCGDNSYYDYVTVNDKGQANMSYNIPATWGDEKVTVGAYLKFSEKGYNQPSNITTKYGTTGQYIIWNTDYSKDMLTYSTITHSNALVEALKQQAEADRLQNLLNTIEKDFKSIDTRVDSFGNIKHVPKGYSFDETNISENVNIYPMIFYDAESKTSYFYIICGYVSTQFLRFEKVGFSADGYNWVYENSTNVKKNQIVANKKAEWIYFNSVDTRELLGDMELFSSSNNVTLSLIGSVNKTYTITANQLNNIKNFLYIYETYYGNGTTVPDTSWFSMTGESVSLSYIQKPSKMYQRGHLEINSLKSYSDSLSQKRLNGQTVTAEETALLETMNKTYRTTSDSILTKIIDMLKTTKAEALYYSDYETNKNYMKIYFNYADGNIDIESGKIPYINIYDDCTVIVPIKTITAQTTGYDKVYARFTISQSLYNELSTYYANKQYEQIN